MSAAVKKSLISVLATAVVVAVFSAAAIAAPPAPSHAADEQSFKEFEQIVADFGPSEKVQAWEAFLQKYPGSSYVPKVREILADLKGEKPKTAPTPAAIVSTDPDLDFLNEKPNATPRAVATATPRPVAIATPTPRPPAPKPTPAVVASNGFLDGGTPTPPPKSDRFSWNESGNSDRAVERVPETRAYEPPRSPRPRGGNGFGDRGIGRANHTEISPFVGISPDETYVRNLLVGVSVSEHFGRTWSFALEGAGSQDSETPLLRSLRNLDAEPEVISKYNYVAGATVGVNLLSAQAPISNAFDGRNDLYIHGGGGVVNTNVEICKQTGGTRCAAPLFVNGVNFTYAAAGVGHRFYFTKHFLFRTEIRGRLIFELIDGKTTPRPNVQIDLGPSFLF